MDKAQITLKYLEVLIWPATLTMILFIYRDSIVALLQRSKIKLSLYGFEVETTISELETVTQLTIGGDLDQKQLELLSTLKRDGSVDFRPKGIPKNDRKWIRPIMNAGLIMTLPEGAHLGSAKGLKLSPLGGFLVSENRISAMKKSGHRA